MFYSKKLKKFKGISHCFFSKKGGFSKGIYSSLNCGRGSRDNKINVKKNIFLVSKKMRINPRNLILMNQTHSKKVIFIDAKNKNTKKFSSDAIITKLRGYALGVVTADCVPIILYDSKNHIIGCVHAGWKGALSGIIEKTISKFNKLSSNNKIFASIGPCIGEKSYEVDFSFYKKFKSKSEKNIIYFRNKNKHKKLFNLRKFVSDKLIRLKVNVDNVNYDTYKEKDNFFSYRRSQKYGENDYGRCISIISLSKFSQN
tara:strand:+ start:893 stop:1663 length:771 start_codon:yes stop_codon:yes gene_type:complete